MDAKTTFTMKRDARRSSSRPVRETSGSSRSARRTAACAPSAAIVRRSRHTGRYELPDAGRGSLARARSDRPRSGWDNPPTWEELAEGYEDYRLTQALVVMVRETAWYVRHATLRQVAAVVAAAAMAYLVLFLTAVWAAI